MTARQMWHFSDVIPGNDNMRPTAQATSSQIMRVYRSMGLPPFVVLVIVFWVRTR